jgi:F-type H+-transporting ATPase subunit gamma
VYQVEPAPALLREFLLPLTVKADFFCTVLEALLSEHAQRAVAMRSASDNADSMIKRLTLQYNRARQAQITNEMIEIVSASEGSRA